MRDPLAVISQFVEQTEASVAALGNGLHALGAALRANDRDALPVAVEQVQAAHRTFHSLQQAAPFGATDFRQQLQIHGNPALQQRWEAMREHVVELRQSNRNYAALVSQQYEAAQQALMILMGLGDAGSTGYTRDGQASALPQGRPLGTA